MDETKCFNTKLMPGAYVDPNVVVEEDVYIGPNAVVLGKREREGEDTSIKTGAEIGANSTICPGVTIGLKAKVLPGSVVTRSVPPLAIVEGNPARIKGYLATTGAQRAGFEGHGPLQPGVQDTLVLGVRLHILRTAIDIRGNLSVGEFDREIPFIPKRYFLVFEVPTAETRGEHAHLRCQQFLIAVKGSIRVVADDGRAREEFILDRPNIGLYFPKMTWGINYHYSADAVLLVFASDYYEADDYVRDYSYFLSLVQSRLEEA
jgi:UDP-2-acetamido-3-amino-2,3-dideoxy-glucuronate N-acetyltransferase